METKYFWLASKLKLYGLLYQMLHKSSSRFYILYLTLKWAYVSVTAYWCISDLLSQRALASV